MYRGQVSVFALRLHSTYRCRHSGVCCNEGWDIAVDAPLHALLTDDIRSGALTVDAPADVPRFVAAAGLPHGEPVVAGRIGCQCVFFEPDRGRLCAIQRQRGHQRLPSACQHFPRVVTMDPRGVFVSLSHVCPTAASLLFADCDDPFALVSEGPLLTHDLRWEGLDARDALPPQLSAQVLWDWTALARWEDGVRRAFDRGSPERALHVLRLAAARLENWRPSAGPALEEEVALAIDDAPSAAEDADVPGIEWLDALVRQSVPDGLAVQPAAAHREAIDGDLVVSGWHALDRAVGRFLAARAIANWTGYHAASATAWVRSLEAAYAVLRVECARQSAASNRPLDRALFTAAAADADRLLVHRVDAAVLARHLYQRF